MSLETVRAFLGWSAILNLIFVSIWFLIFMLAHDWIFFLHRRWFDLSRESFDAIHYAGMACCKIFAWLFFIMPYFALRLIGSPASFRERARPG